jgi:site-specific recombinase XerC
LRDPDAAEQRRYALRAIDARHDCIASTQVYTELSIRQLKKVHAMTHPAAGEIST